MNHRGEVQSFEQNTTVKTSMEVADMDWEEQLCQDLDRSYFSPQMNQSRYFSDRGRNDLEPEQEKSGVEKESEELRMIGDIVASGRAAVNSSSEASSAA